MIQDKKFEQDIEETERETSELKFNKNLQTVSPCVYKLGEFQTYRKQVGIELLKEQRKRGLHRCKDNGSIGNLLNEVILKIKKTQREDPKVNLPDLHMEYMDKSER